MKRCHWFLVKSIVVLYYTIYYSHAKVTRYKHEELASPNSVPSAAPTIAELPLPANVQHSHKPHWKDHSWHPLLVPARSSKILKLLRRTIYRKTARGPSSKKLAPTQGIASIKSRYRSMPRGFGHPPVSRPISSCCKSGMILKRVTWGCQCVYPIRLDILLLNVSTNPNWNLFLSEFSSQLGLDDSQIKLMNFYVIDLSRLNISMDITPNKGIGFSAKDASAINVSLRMHKVHLDSKWVGDYRLINLTWFQAPSLPQAPGTIPGTLKSPTAYHSSTATEPSIVTRKNKRPIPAFIIIIAAGILGIVLLFVLILLCTFCKTESIFRKSGKRQNAGVAVRVVESCIGQAGSTRFLPYEELKEATNNFETASILGEGGFGRVFKGVLSDGTAVAIKRLSNGGQQGDKEFSVEVEMLSRLHHRNLVKLIGYYRDSSQSLLCYELVPNGSLESWLHGPLGEKCSLDWEMRMKIALDAARGLAYLHEDSQPCVIHRDFKASNILLENNFHAKVSDFGLAKQAPEGRANYLSTRVMGTFGYVAPEYAMTGHLLVKSDVYSYGVVLLELLSGRKAVDMSQGCGQENLVTWARVILRDRDRLEEVADPKMGGKYGKEDFARVCTIAAACVAVEAGQRPTMGEVVQSLKLVQQDSGAPGTLSYLRNSSNSFDSDGTSSIFSSAAAFDNDRQPVFSEDLHQGR